MASTDAFWSHLGLQAKIFLLSLLVVVGLTGALLLFSFQRADELARESLQSALASTRGLFENLESDRIDKLSLINSVIVESPYFKAAVVELDEATTLDTARTMVEQVGSDFMIVTDYEGLVVARTDLEASTGVDLSADPLVAYALDGEEVGGVWYEGERLYHAVSIPLLFGPELIGTVVSGYEIGDTLAANIKRFANSEVVFFTKTADGFEQAGSTLAENTEILASWLVEETMPAEAEDVRVELAGETYQAVFAPLLTVDGEAVGVFAALRSRDRELAAFRSFQRSVAFAGLLGIGLAVFASHLVARSLAQPIRDLVEVTNRIREGDYASDVEIRSADEIGALAKSFRVLLRELREKQEMEKFISQSAAEMIQRSGANIGVGERQPVTVLFSDLKSHAAFRDGTEKPVEVLSRVNDALSSQAELVERYGGLVDKFIGDRMMAVFKGRDRVWPAIRCAISIQHLVELDDKDADNVLVPGIGVSAGDAVFGAVGSSDRLDYSLLGPVVHIAGRLASDALPGDVLLSQDAFETVKDRISGEALEPMRLHGFDEPVGVFSLATGTTRQSQIFEARSAAAPDGEATWVSGAGGAEAPKRPAMTLSSLEPGTILAKRYEIRRVLGSGGMGMVFQAHDRDLDEPVALKVLRPETLSLDPSILERFKTEIRVARRIAHRNIVRTFDFGEAGGIQFISMEFVQGMTLKQLIRSRGCLPLNVGLQIAKQTCAGLAAAHEAKVVHCDVKPQNIMLTHQSEVKLMDFGIVREQEKDSRTQTGLVMGTPDYMSPEQAQGKSGLDFRSDIYSVGVVFFEMFTGELPFSGDSAFAVALKHVQEAAPTPRAVNPRIPEALEAIIVRCMAKDPAERYQQIGELQADLYRISNTANVAAAAS